LINPSTEQFYLLLTPDNSILLTTPELKSKNCLSNGSNTDIWLKAILKQGERTMHNPNFSSGPCSKRPKWDLNALKDAPVGRSHRSGLGKEKLSKAIKETKRILGVPDD
jgi:hypothetical protein